MSTNNEPSIADEIFQLARLLTKHRDRVAIVAGLKSQLPGLEMVDVIHCVQYEAVIVTVKQAGADA